MKSDSSFDARLDRLIDEELRAVLDAPPVELRAKVLAAIDEEPATRNAARGTRDVESGFSAILRPRWAFGLAAAAVLVLAALVTWRGGVKPGRESATASRAPLAGATIAAAVNLAEPSVVPAARVVAAASARRARPLLVWEKTPVAADTMSASNEPYMPGAPAGDLGDPLRPLPSPPPISFAPIASAPPVSAFARPVTDFPANNSEPAADSGSAGPSGGTRR